MLIINKHDVPTGCSEFVLSLPRGSKIFSFQEKEGKKKIWALSEVNNKPELRTFLLISTGSQFFKNQKDPKHIGTLIYGRVAEHLFEITKKMIIFVSSISQRHPFAMAFFFLRLRSG